MMTAFGAAATILGITSMQTFALAARSFSLPSISFRCVAPPVVSLMPAVNRMTEQPVKAERSELRTAVVSPIAAP
jgi:hypothetical protein